MNENKLGLSARWTHEESEHLHRQADRMNFGDITSWARGNPWFKRPEVATTPAKPNPVHNLAELRKPRTTPAPASKAEKTVMIGANVTKFDAEQVFAARNARKIEISNAFDALFERCVVSRNGQKVKKPRKVKFPA